MLTDDELRRLLADATPGPWALPSDWVMAGHLHVATIPRAYNADWSAANGHLIAAAPELAAEVLRLREALKKGADLISGDAVGSEWKRGCRDFLADARAALNPEET